MSRYLFQVGYTAESWQAQLASQANVVDRITPLLQSCGGSIDSVYYAFGDKDLILIADFPTPQEAAAFSLTVYAAGALRSITTTPLLTIDEGLESMRKAHEAGELYRPPVATPVGAQRVGR